MKIIIFMLMCLSSAIADLKCELLTQDSGLGLSFKQKGESYVVILRNDSDTLKVLSKCFLVKTMTQKDQNGKNIGGGVERNFATRWHHVDHIVFKNYFRRSCSLNNLYQAECYFYLGEEKKVQELKLNKAKLQFFHVCINLEL